MMQQVMLPTAPPRTEHKFHLGALQTTPGALLALQENGASPQEFLARHSRGDWGDVSPDERVQNELAIGKEACIWSIYHLPLTNEKLWIITEADRSRTTILLPDEY